MTAKRLIQWVVILMLPLSLFTIPSFAWEVSVKVAIPDPAADSGFATTNLVFGVNPDATDDFDNLWDVVAFSSSTLNVHFLHVESPPEKAHLWKDLRADSIPKQWEAEVSSPLNGQVEMTWNSANVPGDLNVRLVVNQSGDYVDMKQSGTYTFKNTPDSSRKLTVQVSEKSVSSNGSATSGGGGCGYIKGVGKGTQSSLNPGSAALNLIILFTPLIWLAVRRAVFSQGVILYGNTPLGEIRNDKENVFLLSWLSFLSACRLRINRMWRWRLR